MWMLYAIFIFALVLIVSFHAAEHQESNIKKSLMKAAAFLLTAGVFGALYLTVYLFSNYAEWNIHNAGIAVISLPIAGAVYYALAAFLLKLSLPGKSSTLNEDRRPALICWTIAAVSSILLPAFTVKVNMNKTGSSGDTEYITHSKFIGVFKLIRLAGDFEDKTAVYYKVFIILTFIVIPLLCLAVNFIVPSRMYIWANICGMTAHCTALALASYLISDDSIFGEYIILKTTLSGSLEEQIVDSAKDGFVAADSMLKSGLSAYIPLVALIFLCGYLAVTTFYYTYTQREKHTDISEHHATTN